ncbi:MAG: amidohydrolase family protein [bacterium]|nr:amidohydrolase family protein [bacterium]
MIGDAEGARAAEPHTIAVTGARIVTGDGQTIEAGTILIDQGRIVEVGEAVEVPAYAEVIDAAGHVVYPGFIDAHSHLGIADTQRTETQRRRVEDENPDPIQGPLAETRAANRRGIRAEWQARELYAPSKEYLERHRKAGFATALAAPRSGVLAGSSILVSLSDIPLRRALLRAGVGQHAGFSTGEPGAYPGSRLGSIAQFRQVMYDARWYAQAVKYARRHPRTAQRPPSDAALDALQPVLIGQLPLIFEADSEDEIRRALDLAAEFNIDVVISGATEAWRLVDRLKRERVRLIVSLKFPEEPEYGKKDAKKAKPGKSSTQTESTSKPTTQPGDEPKPDKKDEKPIYEPLKQRRERRRLWEERVANVIRLHEAGIEFALGTRPFGKPEELLESLRLVIERGLPEDAAVAALSSHPAELFGMDKRLGRIGPGYSANLTIVTKPLGDKKAKVRWVIADGYKFDVDPKSEDKGEKKKKDDKAGDDADATADAEEEDHGPQWRCEIEADRVPKTRTAGNVLIRGATVIPVVGEPMPGASILVTDGRIEAVGPDAAAPDGVTVIEAGGWYVMPGIIDAHSHLSTYGANEGALAVTAEVRIQDVLRRRSASVYRALAGGATTALVLHGSANPIGGQSAVIKLKYARPVEEMVFADAPPTIKFALGENVTQVNSSRSRGKRFPNTRMGVEATLRRSLTAAADYFVRKADFRARVAAGEDVASLRRDLRLESLAEVLAGERYVHCHCYRADEILRLLDVAEDYGFRIACLQHVLEGYRVAPEIARHGCGASTFANFWAYKIEAYNAVPYNVALMNDHGVCTSVNSDSVSTIRLLPLEAAKCIKWGGLDAEEALRLITINPARQLGIDHRVGSIEVGKDADLAVFNGHPLNSFSKCVLTLIEGEVFFEHDRPEPSEALDAAAGDLGLPALVRPSSRPMSHTPHRLYAVVGATVHPMSGPPIADGTVVIQNDKILAVGHDVTVPPGAGVIDGAGLHVYPGLIDAGSTLGANEIGMVASTRDDGVTADFAADLNIAGSINPHSVHIPIARQVGITTALSVPRGGYVSGQSAVLHLDGWTLPEMLVADTYGLHVSLPVLPVHLPAKDEKKRTKEHDEKMRRIEAFFGAARRYADRLEAAETDPGLAPTPDLTLEAMGPYLSGVRPVVFRVSRYKAILEAIVFAEKHELRCVINGGTEAWKLADTLAEKDIPVILSRVNSYPRGQFEAWDSIYTCAAVLDEAGVRLGFGSRTAAAGAYNLPFDAGLAVAHGLAPERAEYALTLGAARILGLGARLGSLEPGKQADLIVTTHSPLQTVCRVTHMFIDGRPIDLTTKHTRDRDRFANRPKPNLPPPPDLKGPPSLTRR